MIGMKISILVGFFQFLLIFSGPALAVEVSPRITDRVIIESLTELKAGQRSLEQKMDQRFLFVDKRFDAIDKRLESMDRRIDGLRETMLALFGALIALIVALFAYIAWDRRTMVKPIQDRLDKIERDLQRDLELQHQEGSRLTRLVKVLREMAKTDEKLADVLRNFSLL